MDKLFEIKKLYFLHANIHQSREKLKRESEVRDFLDRDEKKLLYQSQHSKIPKQYDKQLIELGVITHKRAKKSKADLLMDAHK